MSAYHKSIGLLPIGTMLNGGRYRIVEYISSGGFGNTYLAYDTILKGRVAIKEHFMKDMCYRDSHSLTVMVTNPSNEASFIGLRDKFRKEAKRLFSINSPYVVRVFDLFDENGTSYYVMDYIEGESLSAWQKRTNRVLSVDEAKKVLDQIFAALESIHAQHIWHMDIKPANIMLSSKNRVVLIDFGASKQTRSTDGKTLTTSSVVAYTLGYAPPEQMYQNANQFGPWTDFYALGATLFNLLTQQMPPTSGEIDDDPVSAFSPLASKSELMYQLIKWMMSPRCKNRPKSVAEIRAWMNNYQTGGNGDTTISVGGGDRPPVQPHRGGLKLAIIVILLVAILCVVKFIPAACDPKGRSVVDSVVVDSVVVDPVVTSEVKPEVKPEVTPKVVTRLVDCQKCSGYGKIPCPKCHGEGVYYDSDGMDRECDNCGGSGHPTSSSLMMSVGGYATGSVTCDMCNGAGKINKTIEVKNY